LGGIEVRLYAQRWPKEVVGMVLVDTSPAGEGLIDEDQPGFDEAIGRESYASYKLYCALLLAKHGPLEPSTPEYKDCSLPLPSDTHRFIKGSGHEIQLDKPQAVIDAVDEVLRQLHAGAKS
jgi:pimeloyl-ACP methyl ester carboxylesterase